MIEVTIKCDLCPQTITVEGRVDAKIDLPKNWTKTLIDSEYRPLFEDYPGPKHFCSFEHSQAYAESVKVAADETRRKAKTDFARRLKLKIQAAISVVDALATLAPEEESGDRSTQ